MAIEKKWFTGWETAPPGTTWQQQTRAKWMRTTKRARLLLSRCPMKTFDEAGVTVIRPDFSALTDNERAYLRPFCPALAEYLK